MSLKPARWLWPPYFPWLCAVHAFQMLLLQPSAHRMKKCARGTPFASSILHCPSCAPSATCCLGRCCALFQACAGPTDRDSDSCTYTPGSASRIKSPYSDGRSNSAGSPDCAGCLHAARRHDQFGVGRQNLSCTHRIRAANAASVDCDSAFVQLSPNSRL